MVARKKKRTIKTGKRSLVGASLEVRPVPVRAELSSSPRGLQTRVCTHASQVTARRQKTDDPTSTYLRIALLDPRADLSPSPSATGHH